MQKKAQFAAILLIVIMFAVAVYTNQNEIIFPETSALALGGWIMERSPWRSANRYFWLSPTLAALTGTIIMRSFPYSPFFMIAGTFVVVALQMKILRSDVFPSLSAAILPIITLTCSWLYPLSVCLLTGTIALGRHISASISSSKPPIDIVDLSDPEECLNHSISNNLIYWSKLFIGVSIVSAMAIKSGILFMVAPPMIVAIAELSRGDGALRKKSLQILVLLSLVAFIGVFRLEIIRNVMQWPIWICAFLSMISVFLFYHYLKLPFRARRRNLPASRNHTAEKTVVISMATQKPRLILKRRRNRNAGRLHCLRECSNQ
jgi:hypothetical protein